MSTTTGPDGAEEAPAAEEAPVRPSRATEVTEVTEPDDEAIEAAPADLADAPAEEKVSVAGADAPVDEETPEEETPVDAPAAGDDAPGRTPGPLDTAPSRLVVVLSAAVLVLAVFASFGLYKWQTASSDEGERRALIKRVADYGNAVADFDYHDLQKSVDHSLSFLTGDALARQQRDLAVSKLQKDWTEKQLTLSSKTENVYVTELNGNLAGAVLVFDINAESPLFGATKTGPQPVLVKSHLTLGMVKVKGVWMVSSLTPAGTETDGSAVPGLGAGTGSAASAAPTSTPTTTK